jgi:hypothetical protein
MVMSPPSDRSIFVAIPAAFEPEAHHTSGLRIAMDRPPSA